MMQYTIEFTPEARKLVAKCKKSNAMLFKKLCKLLDELLAHPRTGTGHPEPLKGGDGELYSRRITASDRLIYRIFDDRIVVLILSVEGHYDDK